MEQQLEHAGLVSDQLAAGDFTVAGNANAVGDVLSGQLLFVFSDHRDFRDRVNAIGQEVGIRTVGDAKGMTRGVTALLHGGRREGGKTDDIACRIDVRYRRLKVGVDIEAAARIRCEADAFQIEVFRCAFTSDGIHQRAGLYGFRMFETDVDLVVV